MKLPKDQIDAYIASAVKEWNGWQKWGSIEAIEPELAAQIMANPATRRRILKARACYRNKSKDPTQLVAKTRVVALGHLDPDLASVSRDAPTPSHTSEYILLAIYIAGRNQLMENDPTPWSLWCGDVSTAFLHAGTTGPPSTTR